MELNENGDNVSRAILSFKNTDSLMRQFPNTDTIFYKDSNGLTQHILNPITNLKESQKEWHTLLENELIIESFKKASSNKQQQSLFMILNLLITALLLSGGTEGMHKLASVYMSFLNKTKTEFELPKP